MRRKMVPIRKVLMDRPTIRHFAALSAILALGAAMRFHGLMWDSPYFFHPDEGKVIGITAKLASSPNPHFSSYGLLPCWLLRVTCLALSPMLLLTEFNIQILARVLAASLGSLSIILSYLVAKIAYKRKVALLAACLLAFSVIHIQQSHFYSVDIVLAFFTLIALVFILILARQGELRHYVAAGIGGGLALATKFSAVLLVVPLVVAHLYRPAREEEEPGHSFLHIFNRLTDRKLWLAVGCMFGVFCVLNPFVLLDSKDYVLHDGLLWDLLMARGYFRPQHTLQYEGTIPYLYYLTNIFFWGLGPFLEAAAILGVIYALLRWRRPGSIVLVSFALVYFLTIGGWRVKFSRYALPLVPVMAILAASFLLDWRSLSPRSRLLAWLEKVGVALVILPSLLYSLAFVQIYSHPDVRIEASRWIYENVSAGAAILLENDKDAYAPPLKFKEEDGSERYHLVRLNFNYLYEHSSLGAQSYLPDFLRGLGITRRGKSDEEGEVLSSEEKWLYIYQRLEQAEYIVFSERNYDLYRRLPELFPVEYEYYRQLFAGKLDFELVKVFERRPGLLGVRIDDSQAELTFKIFDHPTIWIFQRDEP